MPVMPKAKLAVEVAAVGCVDIQVFPVLIGDGKTFFHSWYSFIGHNCKAKILRGKCAALMEDLGGFPRCMAWRRAPLSAGGLSSSGSKFPPQPHKRAGAGNTEDSAFYGSLNPTRNTISWTLQGCPPGNPRTDSPGPQYPGRKRTAPKPEPWLPPVSPGRGGRIPARPE